MKSVFERLRRDIRWGLFMGVFGACLYSAFVLVLYAFGGLASLDISLGLVIAVYFVGGVSVGIILGIFRPLTRWRIGAVAVGIAAALPVFAGIAFAVDGPPSEWDMSGIIVISILLGGVSGYYLWEPKDSASDAHQG